MQKPKEEFHQLNVLLNKSLHLHKSVVVLVLFKLVVKKLMKKLICLNLQKELQ